MNELTIHGNVTAEPVLRRGQTGNPFLTFSVAVNRSYYARERGVRVDLPAVYHHVIAFNNLAENAAATLRKGTTVTVTGYLADDSFIPDGSEERVRRQRLEAGDIAVSLRFATAEVVKRAPAARAAAEDSSAARAAPSRPGVYAPGRARSPTPDTTGEIPVDTEPLDLMTPRGNREQAIDLLRATTGLPLPAALTLDAVSAAVLRTAGVPAEGARPILGALWRYPERVTDTPARRSVSVDGAQYLAGLGERIHVIRRARRLTMTGVCRRTGIEPLVLRDLEAGRAWPSLTMLIRLAGAFEVPLPMLVDDRATPLRILRLLASYAA